MTDVKISDLSDLGPVEAGDLIEIERPGDPDQSGHVELGTAAGADVEDFATAAQGAAADTAVQPGDLAAVATSGAYGDLSGTPTLGTAAALDVGTGAGTVAAGNDARFTTSASNFVTSGTPDYVYTLVLADAGRTVRQSTSTASSIQVPTNASVAFPVDTFINLEQYGAGQVSIIAAGGVTIRSRNGLKLAGQYALATLHKIGTDEWMLGGDLEE